MRHVGKLFGITRNYSISMQSRIPIGHVGYLKITIQLGKKAFWLSEHSDIRNVIHRASCTLSKLQKKFKKTALPKVQMKS